MDEGRVFDPAVIPLRPGSKRALKKGALTTYTPATKEQIDEWISQGLNVGYITGPTSNMVVVDIDNKEQAMAFLLKYKAFLIRVPTVKTPGGWHFYMRLPDGESLPTRIRVMPGIDLLGGSYIVAAPPSTHKGHVYHWVNSDGPPKELPIMPQEMIEEFRACLEVRNQIRSASGDDADFGIQHTTKMMYVLDDTAPIDEGNRNIAMASAASEFMYRSGSQDEDEIVEKLREVNAARCRPPLPDADLITIANSMARVDRRNHPNRVRKPRVEAEEVAAVVDPRTMPKVLTLGSDEDFGAPLPEAAAPAPESAPAGDDEDFGLAAQPLAVVPVVEQPAFSAPEDVMRPEYTPIFGAPMPNKKDTTNDCARWAIANIYYSGILCLGDQYLVRDGTRNVWQETPKACITSAIQSMFDTPKARTDGIEYSIRNFSYFPRVDFPFWYNEQSSGTPPKGYPRDPRHVISFLNGLLDVRTRRLLPHAPQYVSLAQMPFKYDPEAKCPRWMQSLEDWWGSATSDRALALRRWFGYCLIPDCSQHKCLVLHGVSRSGKSTAAKVLHALVGDHGTATTTLTHLTSPHGPSALVGKLLAIMYDAHLPSGGRGAGGSTIEVLKSVIGNDPQPINRKFHDIFTARLSCRILIVCNEIPRMDDAGNALLRRMIPIRCDNSFFGQENTQLTEQLMLELPGIANWALEGLAEYRREKVLFMPKEGIDDLGRLKRATNPVEAFLDDCCKVFPEETMGVRDLFTAWTAWCISANHRNIGSQIAFMDRVRGSHPSITVRGVGINEKVFGISLLTDPKAALI